MKLEIFKSRDGYVASLSNEWSSINATGDTRVEAVGEVRQNLQMAGVELPEDIRQIKSEEALKQYDV